MMENKYNYYDPENNQTEEIEQVEAVEENTAEESTAEASFEPDDGIETQTIFYDYSDTKKKHKRGVKLPKFNKYAKAVSIAVVFGLVAGSVSYGTNRLLNSTFGSGNGEGVTTIGSGNSGSDSSIKLNQTSSTVTSDVSNIVESTMPSVVSITNMSVQEVQSFFGGVQQQESESCGSGIIIGKNDTELLVLTNNHVVESADTLTVSFVDDSAVEASIKGTDANKDLAVVAVPLDSISEDTMNQIKVITIGDSDTLQVGEPVIAIGNALGYGQSVTTGIVSAVGRELDGIDSKLIQTDAAINPGNSGGALLNSNGELVGVNCAKVSSDAVEGMGYAIPISDASSVIEDLMSRETRTKVAEGEQGYLGIQGVDVTSDSAQMYNMPTGVYIANVIEGGGAAAAGLSKGTIITALDGTTIDGMSTLQEQLRYYKAGEEVELEVQVPSESGEYQSQTVKVTLGQQSQ